MNSKENKLEGIYAKNEKHFFIFLSFLFYPRKEVMLPQTPNSEKEEVEENQITRRNNVFDHKNRVHMPLENDKETACWRVIFLFL